MQNGPWDRLDGWSYILEICRNDIRTESSLYTLNPPDDLYMPKRVKQMSVHARCGRFIHHSWAYVWAQQHMLCGFNF